MSARGPLFWVTPHETVTDMFRATAVAHPDRLFCTSGSLSLTYSEAARVIAALSAKIAVAKGRDVALVLPSSAAFLVAYYASLFAGAHPALINAEHPEKAQSALMAGLDLAMVISDEPVGGQNVLHLTDDVVADMKSAPEAELPTGQFALKDAAVLFSGGTTGLPKQVRHSHANLMAKVERMEWGWPTEDHEVWLPVAPFTHVYGFLMGVLNPVLRGGYIIIPPRFKPDLVLDLMREHGVTIFGGGPPALYQAMMAAENFASIELSKLRVCPGGGAPFPLDVHKRWKAATGLPITEGYGMTEIAPIAVNTSHAGHRNGAAGKPVPDTIVEIVDVATGTQLMPVGEAGEVRVSGPHLMSDYAGNAQETKAALRDGYLYTGDIGLMDHEGFLTLTDRKKDVIFFKGFNVFPREIEEALMGHPSVSGACAVGRADDRAGEVPVAFVTLRDAAGPEALVEHCRESLAPYKLPSSVIIIDEFPLTPAKKVDRTSLKARAQS